MKSFLLPFLLFSAASAAAQDAAHFKRVVGDRANESARTVVVGRDGGAVVVGYYYDATADGQVETIILSPQGEILGGDVMGGSGTQVAHGATQLHDGGYLIVAEGPARRVTSEGYLINYAPGGALRWTKTYYGVGGKKNADSSMSLRAVDAAPGDGAYVAGHAKDAKDGQYLALLMEVDKDGAVQWERRYAIGANAYGARFFANPAGGGVLLGSAEKASGAGPQLMMLEVAHDGTPAREIFLTDTGASNYIGDALRMEDGGFLMLHWELDKKFNIVGARRILRVTAAGERLWDAAAPESVTLFGIGRSGSGESLAAGSVVEADANGGTDAWLSVLSDAGEFVAERTYGAADRDELASDIDARTDDWSIVAGSVDGDILVFTMDSEGTFPP